MNKFFTGPMRRILGTLGLLLALPRFGSAELVTVTLDASPAGRRQVIDGFGTCHGGDLGKDESFQKLYFDDLGCSIVRMDLTPRFVAPYSNDKYVSPWFYNSANTITFPPGTPANAQSAGGPEKNNCRTYSGPEDYSRAYGGRKAPIAVMGAEIAANMKKLVFDENGAIAMAKAGVARDKKRGDFKLYGSIWSPAPWVKVSSGNKIGAGGAASPAKGTPWPFIWGGNFAGGRLDTSGKPLAVFDDGTGPTSSLTQFARSTAAYVKGLQDAHGLHFYGISIQNEVNFEEFYNSCTYPSSADYIIAVKAIRKEFARYPDLKDIRIVGPEDLLGGDVWGMWQLGAGPTAVHKNLQYLQKLAADPEALACIDLFCVHGYAADGATAAGADPRQWRWWADGWQHSPHPAIPANVKGFLALNKRSWMTETSGESADWLSPAIGFPKNGGFSVALKIQQALTTGQESAWIYWQFAEADKTTPACLTGKTDRDKSPKYVAAKHFFRHIRPGAVRIEAAVSGAAEISASAYVHEKDQSLTIVLVNSSAQPCDLAIKLPGAGPQPRKFEVYASEKEHLWQPSAIAPAAGEVKLSVKGYGVTTLYGRGE